MRNRNAEEEDEEETPRKHGIGRAIGRVFMNIAGWLFTLALTGLIIGCIAGILLFQHYTKDLPDYSALASYDPPTVTRLYAGDGRLLAEYATEKRVFMPLSAMPKRVTQAFIAAEDKTFYMHTGVDLRGIARAIYTNIQHYGQGKSMVGGSTITQQVVKNFLLTDEKSFERKIKEAILALRISKVYSKDKILELYLNEIYLGLRSYGVAAAALNYFDKSVDDLSIEEAALLAAQPKAPANYDPRRNYNAARDRRNWVIGRMREDGYITPQEADAAIATPITLRSRSPEEVVRAEYFAEDVRRWLAEHYGANALYEGGLVVKTTLDPHLQEIADTALRRAIIAYDRRHGYRGALHQFGAAGSLPEKLALYAKQHSVALTPTQKLAVVTGTEDKKALVAFADGEKGAIPLALMKWAKPGARKTSDIISTGDVIVADRPEEEERKGISEADLKSAWALAQVPQVNGAFVALDPHTGRVLAMSGGYTENSDFNRATQARRQPGSSFKPFVYLAGLEAGLTPATVVLDAPVSLSQGQGMPAWRPANYHDEYYGPVTLRMGLEKSRNTMTVRLAQMIGIERVMEIGKRLGIYDDVPRNFSIVLGAAETTLLREASAYGMLVNGGKRIVPSLVERVDDRHGRTIFRRDARECKECEVKDPLTLPPDMSPPLPEDAREQVIDTRAAYQIVSMLEGVVQRGTATRAKVLKRPVAGKTGTTNDSMDTWFVGFTPDMVAGVYIGYDKPKSLGKKETGGSVALPAFIDFMGNALKDVSATPFRIPRGIMLAKSNIRTGQPPQEWDNPKDIVQEAFISGPPVESPFGPPGVAPAAAQVTPSEEEQGVIPMQPEVLPVRPRENRENKLKGTGGIY